MAFVVETSVDRDSCITKFPKGTALKLLKMWTEGSLQTFSYEDIPPQAFLDSARKTVPDVLSFDSNLGVCPEFRDAVEALEPGMNQFFPVQVLRKRGSICSTWGKHRLAT
jgi:hypothetical protein